MLKSIQRFEKSGINNLQKIIENFMKTPTDMASFVYGIRDEVIYLGLEKAEKQTVTERFPRV